MNLGQYSDWYNITRAQVSKCGGLRLFDYHSSLESVLRSVYPAFAWEASKFSRGGFWKIKSNQIHALQQAEKTLGIEKVAICR